MTIVKTTLLALLLAGGVAAAGEPTAPPASTDPATKPAKPKTCPPMSGSRIRPNPESGCRVGVGALRTYTQEDIQRTGEIDMNEALRKLDPIFH